MTRPEVDIRVSDEAKAKLRRLADARNMSIGQLLDDYAAKKYGAAP